MKKTLLLILCFILAFNLFAISAFAVDYIEIEQVYTYIPEMTISVKTDASEVSKDNCSVKIGESVAEVCSVEKFDKTENSSTVYFIVDVSGSMNDAVFSNIRKKLLSYSNSLKANDKMVVITFGSEINILLNGGESKEERTRNINSIARKGADNTRLFDAIKKAVDMSRSETAKLTDRSYAVLISDGGNYETVGGNTETEITTLVSDHGLPIYSVCVGGTNKDASNLGSISRKSGGSIITATGSSDFDDRYTEIMNEAEKVYLIQINTPAEITSDGTQKALMLKISDKTDNVDIKLNRWITDNEKPTIKSVETKNENKEIKLIIDFSEPVAKANDAKNYTLTRSNKSTEIGFTEANYYADNGRYYAELTPEKGIAKHDDYQLIIKNITDISNERNAIISPNSSYTLGEQSEFAIFLAGYWWIFVIILVIAGIVVAVVLLMIKKETGRKAAVTVANSTDNEMVYKNIPPQKYRINEYGYDDNYVVEKHHIASVSGIKLQVNVSDGKYSSSTINVEIKDKYVFGRSGECNVYFDDPKMSRKHFQIENINGDLYIKDLNSANKTYLNGLALSEKRKKLNSGDLATAGNMRFRFVFQQL